MQKESRLLRYRKAWLFVGYSLVAFVVYSSLTSSPVKVEVNNFDKYAHTFGYFVLMGWFVQLYQTPKSVFVCAVLFIIMGVGLEFIQGATGYRQFDIYDMMANTLGVLIAWVLSLTRFPCLLKYFEKYVIKVE